MDSWLFLFLLVAWTSLKSLLPKPCSKFQHTSCFHSLTSASSRMQAALSGCDKDSLMRGCWDKVFLGNLTVVKKTSKSNGKEIFLNEMFCRFRRELYQIRGVSHVE